MDTRIVIRDFPKQTYSSISDQRKRYYNRLAEAYLHEHGPIVPARLDTITQALLVMDIREMMCSPSMTRAKQFIKSRRELKSFMQWIMAKEGKKPMAHAINRVYTMEALSNA